MNAEKELGGVEQSEDADDNDNDEEDERDEDGRAPAQGSETRLVRFLKGDATNENAAVTVSCDVAEPVLEPDVECRCEYSVLAVCADDAASSEELPPRSKKL